MLCIQDTWMSHVLVSIEMTSHIKLSYANRRNLGMSFSVSIFNQREIASIGCELVHMILVLDLQ